ncbi:MAG: dihydropteroate synthase [Sporichthyaceae bacterium]
MLRAWDLPGLPTADRCLVVGVLNATPDSFSDGGAHADAAAAIEHGRLLSAEGADLVDVGGESTRPGAARVEAEEELARVLPVVRGLVAAGIVVSIDTARAVVAQAAVEAGAALVNDVSGGLADPAMLPYVASARVPYVLMHWRGPSADMADRAQYSDVVRDVRAELAERLAAAENAGIERERVILDPGLGFAKTSAHNWELLRRLHELGELGRPLLVGGSRKAFLGSLGPDGTSRPVGEREDATTALTALSAAAGAWAVRVHAPRPSRDAVAVARAWTGT